MNFNAEALITAMESFLDLKVAPDHRPGVATHLAAAQTIAAPLLALDLDDEAEPAPVFTP